MKNSKLRRILLTLACAVLLVSLSVGATLAYLTSTPTKVTNTFVVGEVKIELDEADEAFEKGEAFDGGLRLFTLRGLIAFFSVMGWVGTICCGNGLHIALSIVISVASGFLAMTVIALLMKWLFSLQYDGTEDIREALGVSGTVYMRVPPSRSGKGKITAVIQGKLCEKYAVTDEETIINCDEEVTVVGISGEETLIVRRKHRR